MHSFLLARNAYISARSLARPLALPARSLALVRQHLELQSSSGCLGRGHSLLELARSRRKRGACAPRRRCWFNAIGSLLRRETNIEASLARCGRIGGASALFAVGCSPEHIKAMGRWWSGAYLLYIRAVQGNAQRLMVAACSHQGEYLPDTPDDEDPEDQE